MKSLRIFMDHQIFTMQDYGGISRVFIELYKKFNNYEFVKCQLPMIFSDNVYLDGAVKPKHFLKGNKNFVKRLFYYMINHIFTIIYLLKGNYDVFFPSYYDPYFLPFLKGKPFILVVHDMTHEIYTDTASRKDKTIAWKRKLVYKADKIIAISENTKKDIIKFYGIDESKIELIYWGTTLKLTNKKININLPKQYILYVGGRSKYKNFKYFFKAIAPLLKKRQELYLVCAGGGSFSDEEINFIEEEGITKKVSQIKFRDDDELSYIYNHAICFVYPSLYEGFGSPILEAFACKCPIVLSNRSSLPEIGGDAVEMFDPTSEESIRNTIEKVINNKDLREKLINKGLQRLELFTYEKTIEGYIKVFREVTKKK